MTALDGYLSDSVAVFVLLAGIAGVVASWALNSYTRILLKWCKEERAELAKATKRLETLKEEIRELLGEFERTVAP